MNDDELLTVPEAALRSGLTQEGIRTALHRGVLPHIEKYGRKLIAPADLLAYREGARRGRPKKEAAPANRERYEQPPELTPGEEAALGRAWAELGRERNGGGN